MSRAIIVATIDDALHFSDEQRAEIIASYPAHERDARTKGTPALGSGRIFPIAEENHFNRASRLSNALAAYWRHGLWLGPSVCGRRDGLGS